MRGVTLCLLITLITLITLMSHDVVTGAGNASNETGVLLCGNDSLSMIYCLNPPYVFEENGRLTGGIYYIVQEMVRSCCGEDVELSMSNRSPTPRAVEENFDEEHLAFPVSRSQLMMELDLMVPGVTFLPVIETPGSFVLTVENANSGQVLQSIAGSWPLALVVLSSAGIAGFIIWGLDTYWNPEDFPMTFPKGPWEGTWWAFVTMTTVGYGDRAPRSIPGRIFGLIWMFTGIVIMAIFTAALVTALTAEWPLAKGDIKAYRIGVLNGSVEEAMAYIHGSKLFAYNSIEKMSAALLSGEDELDALLVDSLYGLYWSDHLTDEGIVHTSSINQQSVYGILIQGMNEDITACFSKYVLKHRFNMLDFLEDRTGHISRESHHASDKSEGLVGSDMVIIYVMIAVWISLVLGCLAWEYGYKRYFLKRMKPADQSVRKPVDNDTTRSTTRSPDPTPFTEPAYGSMEMKSRGGDIRGLR